MSVAVPNQDTSPLARPVATLWGVGPERASQLARLEIRTIEDLLLHRPRRYEDRRHFRPIAELDRDEPAITRGTVSALGVKWFKQHTKSIFELILDDGSARSSGGRSGSMNRISLSLGRRSRLEARGSKLEAAGSTPNIRPLAYPSLRARKRSTCCISQKRSRISNALGDGWRSMSL